MPMSQVQYKLQKDGQDYNIMGGWDVPLKSYHLLIEEANPDDDDLNEGIIFSSVYEFPIYSPKTLEPLQKKARELGFELPEVFWGACSHKLGNKFARVTSDGEVVWG
jgi:hypothetical protein